jgi:hypothetical protein
MASGSAYQPGNNGLPLYPAGFSCEYRSGTHKNNRAAAVKYNLVFGMSGGCEISSYSAKFNQVFRFTLILNHELEYHYPDQYCRNSAYHISDQAKYER